LTSDESDLLHNPQKLILIDLAIAISIGTRDHMIDGSIIQIEIALAEHIPQLGGIQAPRIVTIEMPKDLPHLHLQVICVQLSKGDSTICLDMKFMNSLISITPEWSESTSSKMRVV
jgi:hypothetical protein